MLSKRAFVMSDKNPVFEEVGLGCEHGGYSLHLYCYNAMAYQAGKTSKPYFCGMGEFNGERIRSQAVADAKRTGWTEKRSGGVHRWFCPVCSKKGDVI